jgi:hypothetical protein
VFIAALGQFCTPDSIERSDGTVVPQLVGFDCGCSCPDPRSTRVQAYRRLTTGQAYETNWFGDEVKACHLIEDCGGKAAPVKIGISHLVGAGAYRATFGFERSAPSGCLVSGTIYTCLGEGPTGTLSSGTEYASICPTTETVTVNFVLPPTGDIVVPVHIR